MGERLHGRAGSVGLGHGGARARGGDGWPLLRRPRAWRRLGSGPATSGHGGGWRPAPATSGAARGGGGEGVVRLRRCWPPRRLAGVGTVGGRHAGKTGMTFFFCRFLVRRVRDES